MIVRPFMRTGPPVQPLLLLLFLSVPGDTLLPEEDPGSLAGLLPEATFAALPGTQRRMLAELACRPRELRGRIAPCFAGEVPQEVRLAVEALLAPPQPEFLVLERWTSTALTQGALAQGDPVTLTYSFAPDGTFVPSVGLTAGGPSDLFQTLDALFPTPQDWQNRFHEVFTQWGALTGVTYVYEPGDDGAALYTSPGVAGVRGDIRISGRSIDGQSGPNVLAFNFLPSGGGDMVLDTDNVAILGATSGNHLGLRNIVAHEHGHGLGLLHVCPMDQSKLMEPVINLGFDGPQLDDVLGANRNYGDRFEHNETASQAADLGAPGTGITDVQILSLDGVADQDWYRLTAPDNATLGVSVTPRGQVYPVGPQTLTCSSGTPFDALARRDLAFRVLAPDATTVLAQRDAQPAGSPESVSGLALPGPGTYYIHVSGDAADRVQLYDLQVDLQAAQLPAFSITFPGGPPPDLAPEAANVVPVSVTPGTSLPDPSTGELLVSVDGGPFRAHPLVHLGGNDYQAPLPPAGCGSQVAWYVSLAPQGGGAPVTAPAGAPASSVNTAQVLGGPPQVLFDDDFESDQGWSVTNGPGLTAGAWERGVPAGNGSRGDPTSDSDGSGSCYLTGNAAGNADVDGGATMLTSPPLDLSGVTEAVIAFDFWYSNDTGSNPGSDLFLMEISDGGAWVPVASSAGTGGVWRHRRVRVAELVTLGPQVRMRFTASDTGGPSVVEAGLDAFRVAACQPAGLLQPECAPGTGAAGQEAVLRVAGSPGGPARRVVLPQGTPALLGMQAASSSGTAPGFALLGHLGVPGAPDAVTVAGVGTLCTGIPGSGPSGAQVLLVADTFGGALGTGLFPASGLPWGVQVPGASFPVEVTLQGVVVTGPGTLEITNALVLEVR